jgi:putative ABC transport system permease protein
MAIGIGVISGLYPAFYLPAIPTISTLKGAFRGGKSSHMFRNVLITLQFAISLFVIACTLFMGDQIDYVRNKELGFDKDNVLVLPIQEDAVRTHISAVTDELLTNPQIVSAATSSPWSMIGQNVGGTFEMWAEGPAGMKLQGFAVMFVGEDYLRTLGMKLVKGRDFHPGHTVDIDHLFIANEAAARWMNWGNEPLGKKVRFFHDDKDGQVIGIVKDFNFNSLHNPVKPLLIVKMDQDKEAAFLHLKIKDGADISKTIQSVRDTWKRFDPGHPFEYSFLDQRFYQQYKEDEIQKTLLSWLSYLCIFISLLGLIGLSAFTATQRTKEIGVRKVLGANIPDIMILLARKVLFLVVLAAILVMPASSWVMTRWMENFAYRMELKYHNFFVITVAAVSFVFLTVMVQSLKTARSNPVDSLKYE